MQSDDEKIGARIRDMMRGYGVERRAHAKMLASILGISYSAATRKFNGELPWKLEQMRVVASHFGEPLDRLLDAVAARPAMPDDSQNGTFIVANRQFPCTAWISENASGDTGGATYVALQHIGQWLVYPAADLPPLTAHRVARIELDGFPAIRNQPMVAVVDEDPVVIAVMADYLCSHGLRAVAYDSLRAFEDALRHTVFQGVVIDWRFGDRTSTDTIDKIRNSGSAAASIFLVTGDLTGGMADEREVAAAIQRFDMTYMEKPARLPILLAELGRKLGLN